MANAHGEGGGDASKKFVIKEWQPHEIGGPGFKKEKKPEHVARGKRKTPVRPYAQEAAVPLSPPGGRMPGDKGFANLWNNDQAPQSLRLVSNNERPLRPEHPFELHRAIVKESPFAPSAEGGLFHNVFPKDFEQNVLRARKKFFDMHYAMWHTPSAKAREDARAAGRMYQHAKQEMAKMLRAHDVLTPEMQNAALASFVQEDLARLNEMKASLLEARRRESAGRIHDALTPKRGKKLDEESIRFRTRALLTAALGFATVGVMDVVTNHHLPQFPMHDTGQRPNNSPDRWSTEGLVTDEDLQSSEHRSVVEDGIRTLPPAIVEKGEGAEHAFQRLLPRLGDANVRRMFEQLEVRMPSSLDAQADILARALNLRNAAGKSALIPYHDEGHKSSFVATIVTQGGQPSVEIVLNAAGREPVVLLDTQIGVIPYHGRFHTRS